MQFNSRSTLHMFTEIYNFHKQMNVVKAFCFDCGNVKLPSFSNVNRNVSTMFLLMFDKCWIITFQKLKHFIFRLYHLHYNIITIILGTIKGFWTLLVLRTLRSMWRSNKFAQHWGKCFSGRSIYCHCWYYQLIFGIFFNNIIFLFSQYVLWVGLLFWQHSVKTHFKQLNI